MHKFTLILFLAILPLTLRGAVTDTDAVGGISDDLPEQDSPKKVLILKKKPEEPLEEQPAENSRDRKKRKTNYRLGVGIAAVEESDDRFRPAIQLQFNFRRWTAKLQYLDRETPAFTDQTALLSGTYNFIFGKIPFIDTKVFGGVGLGLSYVKQQLTLEISQEEESSWNVAAVFNLELRKKWRQMVFSAGWESHIYPVNKATLYMVITRRQALYLQGSYRL